MGAPPRQLRQAPSISLRQKKGCSISGFASRGGDGTRVQVILRQQTIGVRAGASKYHAIFAAAMDRTAAELHSISRLGSSHLMPTNGRMTGTRISGTLKAPNSIRIFGA
jgi:hypothetical protein